MQTEGSLRPQRLDLHRLRSSCCRRQRSLLVHHRAARPHRGRRRTVLRRDRVRARPAEPVVHPRLPARGRARARPATGSWRHSRRNAAPPWSRAATPTATSSTSGCRATARPSSWASRDPDGRPALARRRTRRADLRSAERARRDGEDRGGVAGHPRRRRSRSRDRTGRAAPARRPARRRAGRAGCRGQRQPRRTPAVAAARAARRHQPRRGPVAAPRADQPGRAGHGAGASTPATTRARLLARARRAGAVAGAAGRPAPRRT